MEVYLQWPAPHVMGFSQDGLATLTDLNVYDDDAAAACDVLFVPGGLGTRALQHDVTWQKTVWGGEHDSSSVTNDLTKLEAPLCMENKTTNP